MTEHGHRYTEHGHRYEDIGFGRLLRFLPYLIAVFTAGSWYESAKANSELTSKLDIQVSTYNERLTRVEDAVIYLKEIVELQREKRK